MVKNEVYVPRIGDVVMTPRGMEALVIKWVHGRVSLLYANPDSSSLGANQVTLRPGCLRFVRHCGPADSQLVFCKASRSLPGVGAHG